jgi:predicted  nucleic acid-binding Zn-ribbon protein
MMSEERTLTEKKQAEKPKKLWDGALKMVKGENTAQLIEQFTSEMTLVAEGLCEDQSKLRREMDSMITEEDKQIQKLQTKVDQLETLLDEERNAHDRDLTELRTRLASLEKKMPKETSKEISKDRKKAGSIIRDATWLVAIAAGAWIIVTILNKFF